MAYSNLVVEHEAMMFCSWMWLRSLSRWIRWLTWLIGASLSVCWSTCWRSIKTEGFVRSMRLVIAFSFCRILSTTLALSCEFTFIPFMQYLCWSSIPQHHSKLQDYRRGVSVSYGVPVYLPFFVVPNYAVRWLSHICASSWSRCLFSSKVGRAPAALNFTADTGWDTYQPWAPKWWRIVYVGRENY